MIDDTFGEEKGEGGKRGGKESKSGREDLRLGRLQISKENSA